jgi:aspartate dehydrogenase
MCLVSAQIAFRDLDISESHNRKNDMQNIAVIGYGAIAGYVQRALSDQITAVVARAGRQAAARSVFPGLPVVTDISNLPQDVNLVVDCAGHEGLRAHGTNALYAGLDVLTVSIGALADASLSATLALAAKTGNSHLILASGAIGALDALSAASVGELDSVVYTGRKPPAGWRGSVAEDRLKLDSLTEAAVHFQGSARDCALAYPKNANVAASVALAGLGFDRTQAQLIADPAIERNIHQVTASGDFGEFTFTIAGQGMPDNPKSSALTAMSVVRAVKNRDASVVPG